MKRSAFLALMLVIPLLMGASSGGSSSGTDKKWTGGSSSSGNSKFKSYFAKGLKAQEREKFADAVKWYRQALKEKPKDADALSNLGFSLRSIGKRYMVEAQKAYVRALKADRDHEGALEYQGELYIWLGQLDQADANLKRLKKLRSPEAKELEQALDAVLKRAKKLM